MIQTVMTLNDAQRHYLRAAIACLLAVQGEAACRGQTDDFGRGRRILCTDLRDEALVLATNCGTVSPLDHQDGAELADLLASGTLELRLTTAAAGITPYYSDKAGGYAGQVPAEDEAWRVPVLLTVVGAETALDAGAAAGEFLNRATQDEAVNADEVVQAFDVGYESAFVPNDLVRGAVVPV